jgi:hypothetical protein
VNVTLADGSQRFMWAQRQVDGCCEGAIPDVVFARCAGDRVAVFHVRVITEGTRSASCQYHSAGGHALPRSETVLVPLPVSSAGDVVEIDLPVRAPRLELDAHQVVEQPSP